MPQNPNLNYFFNHNRIAPTLCCLVVFSLTLTLAHVSQTHLSLHFLLEMEFKLLSSGS